MNLNDVNVTLSMASCICKAPQRNCQVFSQKLQKTPRNDQLIRSNLAHISLTLHTINEPIKRLPIKAFLQIFHKVLPGKLSCNFFDRVSKFIEISIAVGFVSLND